MICLTKNIDQKKQKHLSIVNTNKQVGMIRSVKNQIITKGHFQHPPKTSENLVSDVFRGYRKRPVA